MTVRVAVTGATGNLGTALLRRLAATRGDVDVVGLARRVPRDPAGGPADRVRWVGVDLTRDAARATLQRAFRDADVVVHLAWGFQPSHDETHLRELGVGGTRRVLEAVAAEGVPHLVHMSSVGAYSPRVDDVPVTESYPTEGIRSSMYSRHKSAAERLLDDHQAASSSPVVTRIRPGIVGQRSAGSALLRYGLPGLVPGWAVRLLPLLPIDRRLLIPMAHADDVAAALVRVLDREPPGGAFNLAAPPPLSPTELGEALRARPVHLPGGVLRAAVSGSWQARVQPLDPGWIDLAMQVPLIDTGRAERELGWRPERSATETLEETVRGLRDSASGDTPVLRPRSVARNLRERLAHGPVASRERT